MPTRDELFYWEQRRKATKKQRDQAQRQATIDARYAERRDAVIEADVAAMLADGPTDDEIERMVNCGRSEV